MKSGTSPSAHVEPSSDTNEITNEGPVLEYRFRIGKHKQKGQYPLFDMLDASGHVRAEIGIKLTEFLADTYDEIVAQSAHSKLIQQLDDEQVAFERGG